MKRNAFMMLLVLLMGSSAFAMLLDENKTYHGEGRWKDAFGNTGLYSVHTEIKNKTISANYKFEDKEINFSMTALDKGFGYYDIIINTPPLNVTGEAYCFDSFCHMTFPGKEQLEESFRFFEGKLERLGSKIIDGRKIVWREELYQVSP